MSFRHSNVIPKSFHVLQNWNLVVCHSGVIPCRNDFGMTYLSVWGHSQMEWFGMTIALIPLEWQGWPWNDWTGPRMTGWGGLRRGHSNFHPCHSCPIPSFRHHPGMQFQWGWASNDGGMSPGEGPKLVTFPKCGQQFWCFLHYHQPLAFPQCLWLSYWHHQLVLSCYLHQPESHQLSLNKVT